MKVVFFSLEQLAATPWKNGGGSTREIVSWPPGAGPDAFDWRASVATIAASGAFSEFDGVDRTIMLLEGEGVHLRSADGSIDHRLDRLYCPFAFSGDLAIDCRLPDGVVSTDFNLMSRRARGTAELRVIEAAETLPAATHGLLLSIAGIWRAGDHALAPGQGCWWAAAPHRWTLVPDSPGARVVSVCWTPFDEKLNTS